MRFPLLLLLAVSSFIARGFTADGMDSMEQRFAKLPKAASLLDLRSEAEKTLGGFFMNGSGGKVEFITGEGGAVKRAVRLRTEKKPATVYGFQVVAKNVEPVKKGDALLAIFVARAIELPATSEGARTEFVFELGREPNTKSASMPEGLTREWRKFYLPFVSKDDYAAGDARIIFRAGYDPQTIEIGDVQVLNFAKTVDVKQLPFTLASYGGREADAPWRREAAERIEKIRKGDLAISVVGADGKPLAGADVAVRMKRHAFGFGSAIDARTLLTKSAEADKYRETVAANFNKVVIENHLKWNQWENDRQSGPAAVDWLRERRIAVRGHCLVWPGKKNLPKSIVDLFGEPEKLRAAVRAHVADEVAALRGKLVEWDVLNEPFNNTDLQKILGEPEMAEWFKIARQEELRAPQTAQNTKAPVTQLFINDYSILSSGGRDSAHQDHYFNTIKKLLENGAPLEGIGMQSHFGEDLTSIQRLREILDRFAVFKVPIQSTEFDINIYDEQLQADYTRDFMTMLFSHPSISGIITWGFWEKRHWVPNAAFWRADWSLRPAGEAWKDLVFKKWWTPEQTGKTNAAGAFAMRGFAGEYEVEVKAAGSAKKTVVTLGAAGARTEVHFP